MSAQPPPSCPRCGYDLTGALDSWTDPSQLGGVCSECGLAFEWVRVLLPEKFVIRWFVEHARSAGALWWTAWTTWWRVIVPPRFFAAVTMEHSPRPGRFLLWLPLLSVPVLVLAAAVHVVLVALYIQPFLPASFAPQVGVWYANAVGRPFTNSDLAVGPAGVITGWTTSFSLPGWLWSLLPLWSMLGAWPVVLFLLPTTRARAKVRSVHLIRAFVYSLWWLVIPALVRLGNGLYLLLTGTPSAPPPTSLLDGPDRWIELLARPWIALSWFVGLFAWTAWWWYLAIVRHMRLQDGRRVWALLFVISLLCCVTVTACAVIIAAARS